MGRRGPKPKHTIDAVLSHALELVHQGGLEGLTLGKLARRLETTPSALYRYFPNKAAVLASLQRQALSRLDQHLSQTLAQWRPPLGEVQQIALRRILVALRGWREFALTHPAEHRLIDGFLSAPRPVLSMELALTVEEELSRVFSQIANVLESAVEVGALEPGDANQRTQVLASALHGLAHFQKRDRFVDQSVQTPALEFVLLSGLLTGWGGYPDRVLAAFAVEKAPSPQSE